MLLPKPQTCINQSGHFIINEKTTIYYKDELESIVNYSILFFSTPSGYDLEKKEIKNDQGIAIQDLDNCIILIIDENIFSDNEEAYSLEVSKGKIIIKAKKPNGIFYGIQTLRQLLPREVESPIQLEDIEWKVPCCKIQDYPRFQWRGFMLDEVRHFFGKTFVKRIIDLMALFKLNKLHWHLTDDEGWRYESKKYPKLHEIASKRLLNKNFGETFNLENPRWYGGYYTQEEINEIIEYAKRNFIDVVPEIEMPGHATAPLVAYPEFSCAKPPIIVPFIHQRNRHAYCAGYPKTYEFLRDILDETTDVFTSNFIHIGGDELPEHRWKNCNRCQQFMKENEIEDVDELQVYFAAENIRYLQSKGKTAIGWFDFSVDRLLEKDIDPEKLIFQFWRGSEDKVIKFIEKGGKAIISYHKFTYMDYTYYNIHLKKAYLFNPIPEKLGINHRKNVLGIEAPIWTEHVPNLLKMDYQIFPRLIAYAETGWLLNEKKDFQDFLNRLEPFLKRLDTLNVYYAPLFEAKFTFRSRFIPKRKWY